jgi:hypothetical protein
MFKAVLRSSGMEIILLDRQWVEELPSLRVLDRQDALLCQGCQQPVRVRAGKIKRWHFAHKHLQSCPYGTESPALLQARAALYRRLVVQFQERVTLEKQLNPASFRRPVDCWVDHPNGPFAYWVFDTAVPPSVRESLQAGFRSAHAQPHWLFTTGMLRQDQEPDEELPQLHLTTTEREFMRSTYFDVEVKDRYWSEGKTVHYLDPETEELITYRSLQLVHPPQLYRGRCCRSPLRDVLVSSKTGEFAHSEERERARQVMEKRRWLADEQRKREAEQAARQEEARRKLEAMLHPLESTPLPTPCFWGQTPPWKAW